MFEVLRESLSMHNLPVSALLGMVLLYWLLVIVGVLDNDMDGDGDLGSGSSDSHQGHHSTLGGTTMGGTSSKLGRFLKFGGVPLSVVGSFLAIFMWLISVLSNYYFNGTPGNRSGMVAFLYLFPNLLVSLLLARIVTIPFQIVLNTMEKSASNEAPIIGREGRIISLQVDERYGQVEITTNAAPLLLNAKIESGGKALPRGTPVVVISSSPDQSFHYVQAVASKPLS